MVLSFCLLVMNPAVTAQSGAGGAPVPWSDGAPERWIVADETIENTELEVAERWRVLPGAHLTITDSVLRFQPVDGLAGIVAEPGSAVTILSSTLTTDTRGSFFVHLEGDSLLDTADVMGAEAVVVQPRSLSDHADVLVGQQTEGQVPGWRVVRAQTAASASVIDVTVDSRVIVGVPQGDRDVVATPEAVTVDGLEVTVQEGPAFTCYETFQHPDPDAGSLPVVGVDEATALVVTGATFQAATGPVVHCAEDPVPRSLPDRNVPVAGVPAQLPGPLATPPRPHARSGPATLTLDDAHISGAGTGLLVDTPARVDANGLTLEGLDTGVHVAHPDAVVALTDTSGTGLRRALVVAAGSLSDSDGLYVSGAASDATGLVALGGGSTLTGTTLSAFPVGVDDQAGVSIDASSLIGSATCLRARAATTVTGSTFAGCADGVVLEQTSGAMVTGNTFTHNGDPLQVVSLGQSQSHYDHTVTANTVNGRDLAYLYDEHGATTHTEPTGHLVIAFSTNQRLTDVSFEHGQAHFIQSGGIILGARTDKVGGLIERFAPAALPAYDTVAAAEFQPYEGALIGPRGVQEANYGNAVDQAWALVDAWADAGLDARLVQGRAGGQTDAFLDWVGMEDPAYALAMGGFDADWFGDTYEIDHTWTELHVMPGVHLEVDPSYALYDRSDPADMPELAGFTEDDLYGAMIDGATLDYATRSVTGINIGEMEKRYTAYRDEGFANFNATHPDGMSGGDLVEVATRRAIDDGEDLARTPQVRLESVPAEQRWQVRVRTSDAGAPADSHIDFVADTSDLYGRSLTLESHPDTEAMLDQIVAAGGLYGMDRTSVTYTTFLKVDDEIQDVIGGVATTQTDGSKVWTLPEDPADRAVTYHPGDLVGTQVSLVEPDGRERAVHDSPFRVGGTYAIVVDLAGSPAELLDRRLADYNDTLHLWAEAPESVNVSQSQLVGELYHIQGLQYFQSLHFMEDIMAPRYDVRRVPVGSIAVTGTTMLPVIDGGVQTVAPAPPYFDIRNVDDTYAQNGDTALLVDYRMASGVVASTLEDRTFTQMYDLPAVSTTKAFAVAAAEGIPLHSLGPGETEAWTELSLPTPVMQSIANAVNRGWQVITPQTEVGYYNWSGVGWLEYDPDTGSAGWLIYGGTDPITGSLLEEPIIRHGGAGAQYGPADSTAWWDSGYAHLTASGLDWTSQGVGLFSDVTEKSLKWSHLNNAANIGRRAWDGVGLNNQHRALLGNFDVPTKYGNYAKVAGNAAAIVGQTVDMYDIVTSDQSTEAKYIEVAGVTAINGLTLAASTAAIKGGAIGGAWVGGLLFDGPGAAVGAVAGGIGGAVALAVTSGWAKDTFRSWFD